jgi:hypothetical protein
MVVRMALVKAMICPNVSASPTEKYYPKYTASTVLSKLSIGKPYHLGICQAPRVSVRYMFRNVCHVSTIASMV